jgi:DNA-binding transcriptional ArsR family regulator
MSTQNKHPQPDLLTLDQAEFLAQTFSALSDPTRLRIIFALTQGEQTVSALTEMIQISQPAVSHHLALLRANRLVSTRRDGNRVYYNIDDRHVVEIYREALNHMDHLQQSLPDHNTFLSRKSKKGVRGIKNENIGEN